MTAVVIVCVWFICAVILLGILSYQMGKEDTPDSAVYPLLIIFAIIWPLAVAVATMMIPFLWLFSLGARSRRT